MHLHVTLGLYSRGHVFILHVCLVYIFVPKFVRLVSNFGGEASRRKTGNNRSMLQSSLQCLFLVCAMIILPAFATSEVTMRECSGHLLTCKFLPRIVERVRICHEYNDSSARVCPPEEVYDVLENWQDLEIRSNQWRLEHNITKFLHSEEPLLMDQLNTSTGAIALKYVLRQTTDFDTYLQYAKAAWQSTMYSTVIRIVACVSTYIRDPQCHSELNANIRDTVSILRHNTSAPAKPTPG